MENEKASSRKVPLRPAYSVSGSCPGDSLLAMKKSADSLTGSCLVPLPVTGAPVLAATGPPSWLRENLKLRPRMKISLSA